MRLELLKQFPRSEVEPLGTAKLLLLAPPLLFLDSSLSLVTPRKQTQPNADASQPNHTPLENPSNEERNGYVSPFHFAHLLNLGLMWDRSGAIWRG